MDTMIESDYLISQHPNTLLFNNLKVFIAEYGQAMRDFTEDQREKAKKLGLE